MVVGEKKECCKDEKNLRIAEMGEHGHDGKDRNVKICTVCGCRHIRFRADPVKMNMKQGQLGGR